MIRRLLRLPPKHVHDWQVTGASMTGWLVLKCRTCGAREIS